RDAHERDSGDTIRNDLSPGRRRGAARPRSAVKHGQIELVFELAAGSLWNLLQIEWVRVQLNHLGYPPDRRLPNPGLAPETRPLAWAVPIGILRLLSVVSYLPLPAVTAAMHERARDLGLRAESKRPCPPWMASTRTKPSPRAARAAAGSRPW